MAAHPAFGGRALVQTKTDAAPGHNRQRLNVRADTTNHIVAGSRRHLCSHRETDIQRSSHSCAVPLIERVLERRWTWLEWLAVILTAYVYVRISALHQPYLSPTPALQQAYFSPTSALLQPYFSSTSTLLQPYFGPTSTRLKPEVVLE